MAQQRLRDQVFPDQQSQNAPDRADEPYRASFSETEKLRDALGGRRGSEAV
jgi:hypothetical protein